MSADVVVATGRAADEVLADAVRVLTEAARVSGDWAEFVTLALAGAAANIGSVERVLAGRPGSWEADGVRSLLASTVGWDGDWLLEHRTEPVRVVLYVDEILADLEVAAAYDAAQRELVGREATTDEELDAIADLEGLLEDQRLHDWQDYGDSLKTAVEATAAKLSLRVPVTVTVDLVTYRPYGEQSQAGAVEEQLVEAARLVTPLPASWSRPPLDRLEATAPGTAPSATPEGSPAVRKLHDDLGTEPATQTVQVDGDLL
jgi:hypothetical protein